MQSKPLAAQHNHPEKPETNVFATCSISHHKETRFHPELKSSFRRIPGPRRQNPQLSHRRRDFRRCECRDLRVGVAESVWGCHNSGEFGVCGWGRSLWWSVGAGVGGVRWVSPTQPVRVPPGLGMVEVPASGQRGRCPAGGTGGENLGDSGARNVARNRGRNLTGAAVGCLIRRGQNAIWTHGPWSIRVRVAWWPDNLAQGWRGIPDRTPDNADWIGSRVDRMCE